MKKFTNPSMSTSQKQMSFHKVNSVLFNSLSDLKNSSFVVTCLCLEYYSLRGRRPKGRERRKNERAPFDPFPPATQARSIIEWKSNFFLKLSF